MCVTARRQSRPLGPRRGLDGALKTAQCMVGLTWLQPRPRSTLLWLAGVQERPPGPLCHTMAEMPGTQTMKR